MPARRIVTTDAPSAVPYRHLAPVTLMAFFGYAAIAMPLPALSVHLHEALGFGPVAIGWTTGAQSIVTVVSRNRAGRVIDALGPRRGTMIGLPLAALAGLLYSLATITPGPDAAFGVILCARVVLGIAESLFLTATMAWGTGRTGPEHTASVIAWQGIALYLSLGLGAPLGLWLQQRFGFAAVGAAAVASPLLGLAIAVALTGVPVLRRDPAPFRRVVALVWQPGLVITLSTLAYAAVISFLPLLYGARGWGDTGYAFTGFAVGFILVRLVCPDLASRLGGWRVTAGSLAVETIGQALIWAAPSSLIAALGATLTGVGFSLIFPAMGVEAVRGIDASRRGQVYGNFSAFSDIGIGGTGPLLGLAIQAFGEDAPFAAGALAALAAIAFIALRGRRA